MSAPDPEGHLLEQVRERAAMDVDFRKRLLRDPTDTIYEAFGVRVPAGHRLRFIEKPADVDTLIVLPDLRSGGAEDDELGEDDLDAVAGGDDPLQIW